MSKETPIPPGQWVVVLLPGAVFAVVVADGRVVASAPYGRRRYLGKPWRWVERDLERAEAGFYWMPPMTGQGAPSGVQGKRTLR